MIRRPPYCFECGDEITWSRTENGKLMPVDRHSSAEGNVIYRKPKVAHVLHKDEAVPEDVPRFTAHFATCRNRKR